MPFAWSHTYASTEECLTTDAVTPFLSAFNERIAALGYAHQYPLTPAGGNALTGTPVPVGGDPTAISYTNFVNFGGVPFYSWKALQDLTYTLAFNFFADDATFDINDDTTWRLYNAFDPTIWPAGTGYTRKREPEITSTAFSTGFVNGDRARFVTTGILLHSDYLGVDMPVTSSTEYQYSGKIMLRSGGAWIVDPDQVTPLTLWVLHGRAKPGDVFGPWILNELRDAINTLNMRLILEVETGGAWTSPDGVFEYLKRSGSNTSANLTYAAAIAEAKTNWTAAGHVTTTGDDGGAAGSGLGRFEFFSDRDLSGGPGNPGYPFYSTSLKTMHIRINGSGFQSGAVGGGFPGTGSTMHSMSSDVDLYIQGHVSGASATYTPRPSTVTPADTWVLFDTLGVSAADTRTSDWIGDIDVLPPDPPDNGAAGGSVGWRFWAAAITQRFRVSGGFAYV